MFAQYTFGGSFGLRFRSEPRHRGINLGISLHVPDNWGWQLAAGGDEEIYKKPTNIEIATLVTEGIVAVV